MSKKAIKNQQYENYWKLTVEYSDIFGMQFNTVLKIIMIYIDKNNLVSDEVTTGDIKVHYKRLQEKINDVYPKKDMASTRKSINQFIKLGFIKPFLKGYHKKTEQFLSESNERKKGLIFGEIYYTSSSFNSAVTKDDRQNNMINILLKTLMYKQDKKLSKDDFLSLLVTPIEQIKKGYLDEKELKSQNSYAKNIQFEDRKYNQLSYFKNFLKYIPGITVSENDEIDYTEDAHDVLSPNIDTKRDMTLFRIMKENLYEESKSIYNGKIVCYFTKKEQKGLVVSHILASADALKKLDVESAYDHKNALLLEPNTDQYFDKHDITFNLKGVPEYGKNVSNDFIQSHKDCTLDKEIMIPERIEYLKNHNKKFNEKII